MLLIVLLIVIIILILIIKFNFNKNKKININNFNFIFNLIQKLIKQIMNYQIGQEVFFKNKDGIFNFSFSFHLYFYFNVLIIKVFGKKQPFTNQMIVI